MTVTEIESIGAPTGTESEIQTAIETGTGVVSVAIGSETGTAKGTGTVTATVTARDAVGIGPPHLEGRDGIGAGVGEGAGLVEDSRWVLDWRALLELLKEVWGGTWTKGQLWTCALT